MNDAEKLGKLTGLENWYWQQASYGTVYLEAVRLRAQADIMSILASCRAIRADLQGAIASREGADSGGGEARVSDLTTVLRDLNALVGGVDNGYCRLCGAHRPVGDDHPCEGYGCISHRVAAALRPRMSMSEVRRDLLDDMTAHMHPDAMLDEPPAES